MVTADASHAANHFGPVYLSLSAGFEVHREDPEGWVVVRKQLV